MCIVHGSKYVASCRKYEGFECCACCNEEKCNVKLSLFEVDEKQVKQPVEKCKERLAEFDGIGHQIATTVHEAFLERIGDEQKPCKGFPYEDQEMAILYAETNNISIDKYPELLKVRDIFQKCLDNKDYENFIRSIIDKELTEELDCYLESKENQKKENYKVQLYNTESLSRHVYARGLGGVRDLYYSNDVDGFTVTKCEKEKKFDDVMVTLTLTKGERKLELRLVQEDC